MSSCKSVYWFQEVGKEDINSIGKKCANLGEMTRMGLRVPPGFAISIDTYRSFLGKTMAGKEISHYVSGLGELKGEGIARFEEISQIIRNIIENKEMPEDISIEISSYYGELCSRVGIHDVAVSVRSAGTESRPGMFETYLNVQGIEEVLDKLKKVWASAYTPRAIAFRINKGLPVIGDELGVAVLKMVNAKAAGIGFTVDPVSGDISKIVIEANWGLGEGVVSGAESVDKYVVDKETSEIIASTVAQKLRQVVNEKKGVDWEEVPLEKQSIPCLSNEEIIEVAKLARLIEEHERCPQDIEWAIDNDFPYPYNMFLLQTRPAKVIARTAESTTDRIIDLIAKRYRS